MTPNIESFIYLSESAIDFNQEQLVALNELSLSKNKLYSVTGFLYYRKPYFIQYFEGTSGNIQQLRKNVLCDSRHLVKHWLNDREKQERRFKRFITQNLQPINDNKDAYATAILIMDTLVLSLKSFIERKLPVDGHTQSMIFEKIDDLARMFSILEKTKNAQQIKSLEIG